MYTKMLPALQCKTLGRHEVAERMTTTIDINDRTHLFEISRDGGALISTNIRTTLTKAVRNGFLGKAKKDAAA